MSDKPRVPTNWAPDAEFPGFQEFNPGGEQLYERFRELGPSNTLATVWDLAEEHGVEKVLHERQYIDADYRDEFANFYSSTFPPYPDRTERVHFFRSGEPDDEYVGFSAIRPVPGRPICRTVIAPPDEIQPAVSCVADCSAHPYGLPLTAKGFPFIQQDFQYGVCAHASIWMIAYYYHLALGHGRHFVSDMVRSAAAAHGMDRLTPSTGLTISQMARVLRDIKLPAIAYETSRLKGVDNPDTIACRYLNSRIPVLVITGDQPIRHSKVLIGYRKEENRIQYICHDDQVGPYQRVFRRHEGDQDGDDWHAILVPLLGRIYLSGESAERLGSTFFMTQANPGTEDDPAGPLHGVLDPRDSECSRMRSYVVRGSEYKKRLAARNLPDDVARMVKRVNTSQWIWVVELQDRSAAKASETCVVAEVALDATSDPEHQDFLFAVLPGAFLRWPQLGGNPSRLDTTLSHEPYKSGTAIHCPPIMDS